jgi:hypothetical protein
MNAIQVITLMDLNMPLSLAVAFMSSTKHRPGRYSSHEVY